MFAPPAAVLSDAGIPADSTSALVIDPGQSARHAYYRGYLAETLAGDSRLAAGYYQEVLGHGAEAPALVAQASLRLAGWSELNQQRREAMDLAVRASILGADIPRIKSEADALRLRLASTVKAQDIEVRGPPAGTVLRNVSEEIATSFAEAEVLLSAYHKRRLKPRLEALATSVRSKRAALARAVRGYQRVAESGKPEAVVAAEFRIASLYYDFSLSLSFELPPELDPAVARNMRSQLRAELRHVRGKARLAYQRSLRAGSTLGTSSKEWVTAAEIGLASVEDIIQLIR